MVVALGLAYSRRDLQQGVGPPCESPTPPALHGPLREKAPPSSSDGQQFPAGGRGEQAGQVNLRYGTEPGVLFYTHLVRPVPAVSHQGNYRDRTRCHARARWIALPPVGPPDRRTLHRHRRIHGSCVRPLPLVRLSVCAAHSRLGRPTPLRSRQRKYVPRARESDRRNAERQANGRSMERDPIKRGTVTASLILRKLGAYPTPKQFGACPRELGRVERT